MQKQAPDNDIGAMMSGLQQAGADKAVSGLGDILGALGGAQGGGGGLDGILGGMLGGGDGQQPQAGGGLGGLLQMLDQDGDGSPMNEIVGMLMKK